MNRREMLAAGIGAGLIALTGSAKGETALSSTDFKAMLAEVRLFMGDSYRIQRIRLTRSTEDVRPICKSLGITMPTDHAAGIYRLEVFGQVWQMWSFPESPHTSKWTGVFAGKKLLFVELG